MSNIRKIVLTGGPCAGKTTALPFLITLLKSKGWKVLTVPETATLLAAHGVQLGSNVLEEQLATQASIIKLQITLEDAIMASAKQSGKDCVIICDRGLMDAKAYTPPAAWPQFLSDQGLSEVEIRDGRYDAVFHLTSAAIGAKEFYNNDNPARFEDVVMAVDADARTQNAWIGHPHLRVIDNSTNFPLKMARLCAAVEHFLNPDRKEIERRYLVEADLTTLRQQTAVTSLDITQTYLRSIDDNVCRIRRRGELTTSCKSIYYFTAKGPKEGASCVEAEKKITLEEFDTLSRQHDPGRQTIYKRRHYFLYSGKQFELDEFVNPHTGMKILEIELDSENDPVELPPFIKVIQEITTDPAYSNWNLANARDRNDVVAVNQ